jgi:2-dehydropantoate 2-reductase
MKRKILIFGAGVIGSTYGGLLAKSGHNVTLLARNKRLNELREKGLLINRINQKNPEKISVEITDDSQLTDSYDYVFVTLRNDQVKSALSTLSKIDSTCFVFMVNNPTGYSEWVNALGSERVLPAFPGSGGKIENGIVYYEIVSKLIQPTTLGELTGDKTERLKDLRTILKKSGFFVSFSKNMDAWQKTHVAMVAPLGDVIYYDGGTNYSVSKNKKAIRQMNLALKENFTFLKKSGIGIEPFRLSAFRFLPLFILNPIMRFAFNTKWAETVISNHALNARHEMEIISNDFLQLADSKGFKLQEFEKLLNC